MVAQMICPSGTGLLTHNCIQSQATGPEYNRAKSDSGQPEHAGPIRVEITASTAGGAEIMGTPDSSAAAQAAIA